MRECRAEGCPHIAADGCDYCKAHDEDAPDCCHGFDDVCAASGCLMGILGAENFAPETFEDTIGCDMCGAHIDDPCDCFDPQGERRYR